MQESGNINNLHTDGCFLHFLLQKHEDVKFLLTLQMLCSQGKGY